VDFSFLRRTQESGHWCPNMKGSNKAARLDSAPSVMPPSTAKKIYHVVSLGKQKITVRNDSKFDVIAVVEDNTNNQQFKSVTVGVGKEDARIGLTMDNIQPNQAQKTSLPPKEQTNFYLNGGSAYISVYAVISAPDEDLLYKIVRKGKLIHSLTTYNITNAMIDKSNLGTTDTV
jgi:hypothetical protein